jgi:cobalamin biosynthesis protein CobT
MKKIKTTKFDRSSFWIDRASFTDWKTDAGHIDYTKLAATQRAIANFVSITTGKQIPVLFKSADNSYTDGERVVIGTDTSEKSFDPMVGLALHEASHIAHTEFGILSNFKSEVAMQGLDPDLNLTDEDFSIIKNLLNWVEDRRIDLLSYNAAPGYRNYYESMYDKYFNAKIIDTALKEGAKKEETWDDYLFHIINFTNANRDLTALQMLTEVWNLVDLKNISRLKSTRDAFEIACKIYKLINNHLKQLSQQLPEDLQLPKDAAAADGESSEISSEAPEADHTNQDDDSSTNIPDNVLSSRQQQQLDKAIQKQQEFLDGDTKKSGRKLSKQQARAVQTIKESGTEIVTVPKSYGDSAGIYGSTDTVVIRRMTKNLIDHYDELFTTCDRDVTEMQQAVMQGVQLGKQLGRKLQLRNENRTLKTSRLENGKIDRRLISELGYGNVNVFHRIVTDAYKKFMIHISIDASGSMNGPKMRDAMKSAVAVAQAASMTTGIRVQISFRGTAGWRTDNEQSYTLYAYDSATDKMNKIKTMFKHITTFGCTPEGAAFQSIEKYILADAKGDECIFINYSDGEPSSGYVSNPVQYTKNVINKFRNHGLQIVSFFVTSGTIYGSSKEQFRTMYGQDAEFVDSTRLIEIAKSLNKRFLEQKTTV